MCSLGDDNRWIPERFLNRAASTNQTVPDAPDRVCATKGVRGEGRNWSNLNLDLRQAYLEKRISRARTGRTVRESS